MPAVARRIITDTATRGDLEARLLALLDAERLPRPLVDAGIDPDEPDFTWREQRLIVEVDADETHGTRAAFERDRARDRALQRRAGASHASPGASSATTP